MSRIPGRSASAPGLLGEFVRLKDDEVGSRIRKFVLKRGVLGLCQHGLPERHVTASVVVERLLDPEGASRRVDTQPTVTLRQGCPGAMTEDGWIAESLDRWRRTAVLFDGLLRAALDEHAGKQPRVDVWKSIDPRLDLVADRVSYRYFPRGRRLAASATPPETMPPVEELLSSRGRTLIGALVDDLLVLGDVRLGFEWGKFPEVELEVDGLFGALVLALMFAVRDTFGFAICSECNNIYFPTREPTAGRRNYCELCRADGAPERYASRMSRRRKSDRDRGSMVD